MSEVVNFLTDLFEQGYQYRSLNSYRSAISSTHDLVDGVSIGQHPLVTRLLKGAFNQRPPLPRYSDTWKVDTVTDYIKSLPSNNLLSLTVLTKKTVMLMSLVRPARSADLAKLVVSARRDSPEGISFLPEALAKQSRPGRQFQEFFYPRFPHEEKLCPVKAIEAYIEGSANLRDDTPELFVALIKPHKAVTPSTIARWIKTFLGSAGINTDKFKAHSVRGASASCATESGLALEEVMKAADWSCQNTFQKFYYKPTKDSSYGHSILDKSRRTQSQTPE